MRVMCTCSLSASSLLLPTSAQHKFSNPYVVAESTLLLFLFLLLLFIPFSVHPHVALSMYMRADCRAQIFPIYIFFGCACVSGVEICVYGWGFHPHRTHFTEHVENIINFISSFSKSTNLVSPHTHPLTLSLACSLVARK